ncbi:MAG TPA: 50S ribosomal protein L32 [Myxococcota bacterium]|nr:50S ribosomal protein L32 [Myxococcota bacterium]HQK49912.1 50S ribosomal protein L32 [Myxococcota bacterium]
MAVPKKKTSKARRDSRRATHDKVTLKSLVSCSRCGEPRLPHRACPKCGFYKDRIVPGVAEG